jgi:predicted DNA-binding antitoxin AbrB/MazE fold protein
MTQTLEAIFDGNVLRLEQPLEIKQGTRVRITIEALPSTIMSTPHSFLQTARSLQLDGPHDWSEKIDEYLYGSEA